PAVRAAEGVGGDVLGAVGAAAPRVLLHGRSSFPTLVRPPRAGGSLAAWRGAAGAAIRSADRGSPEPPRPRPAGPRGVVRRARGAAVARRAGARLAPPPGGARPGRDDERVPRAPRGPGGGLRPRAARARVRGGSARRDAEAPLPPARERGRACGVDRERPHPADRSAGRRARPSHALHLDPGGLR